jgi:hypothetical protein
MPSHAVGGAGGRDPAASAEASLFRDLSAGRDAAMHFRVISVLGRGGFGIVFKVWHAALAPLARRVCRRAATVPRVCRCAALIRGIPTPTRSTR